MAERSAEAARLAQDAAREANWKRWGPYLAERQWATVREDYSANGDCWDYLPHDHARSRAYRWGEDGLLGITDRECRLCFALALWNGRDPILKERLFGLSGPEGNHGEDVKEAYFYLDSTPTHAYMKALYKYPQAEFPYTRFVEESKSRTRRQPEFELLDTGVFNQGRYFDVFAEYAKATPDDILIRVTIANRGPEAAPLHFLPTLWFRNTWTWGCTHEGCWLKPRISRLDAGSVLADHVTLGKVRMVFAPTPAPGSGAGSAVRNEAAPLLFTDNETNAVRLFGTPNAAPWVKDAFHHHIIGGEAGAINPAGYGTKVAAHYQLELAAGQQVQLCFRLFPDDQAPADPLGGDFDRVFTERIAEADEFYQGRLPAKLSAEQKRVSRQAYAGLLWSKQFYHYVMNDWLDGDPNLPPPPEVRKQGRNHDWRNVFTRDVLSMPDKWEYPWFAAWDLAFHMIPFARLDAELAKSQLLLLLREWYMHPNGQVPAYEFSFGDVNPPVHAWACWRVYKMTGPRGRRDRQFLARAFQKLMLNFTWWVNRKDLDGQHIFAGGFLGLDNIGVFDRSRPLPNGVVLAQADGTAWMAFYCATMLSMALELAAHDPVYEDVASKFFEHFVAIADAINNLGGTGLWDEQDGFYYDQMKIAGTATPLRIRSIVGIIPLFTVEVLEDDVIKKLPGFRKRMEWFLQHRRDLARHITYMETIAGKPQTGYLLAIPSRARLERVLRYVLDEAEFLSPHGVRSMSRVHAEHPYILRTDGAERRVDYEPGESATGMFGGNSNWRGPIWFPLNYLLVEALQRYHHFYGDSLKVECPTGSGNMMTLSQVAAFLAQRLASIFTPDANGRRPCHGSDPRFAGDPHWRDLLLFYEYFHAEDGRGLGASHQTGWTALVTRFLEELAWHGNHVQHGVKGAPPA